MTIHTIAIPLVFLVLIALLLWLVIYAKGQWIIKLILIVVLPLVSFATWTSLETYLGRPTHESLPNNFRILWIDAQEPRPQTQEKGAIYLLVLPIKKAVADSKTNARVFEYKESVHEPRFHRLPYSREMHAEADVLRQMLKEDRVIIGENNDSLPEGDMPQQTKEGSKETAQRSDTPDALAEEGSAHDEERTAQESGQSNVAMTPEVALPQPQMAARENSMDRQRQALERADNTPDDKPRYYSNQHFIYYEPPPAQFPEKIPRNQ